MGLLVRLILLPIFLALTGMTNLAFSDVRLVEVKPISIEKTGRGFLIDLGAVWFAKVELIAPPESVGSSVTVVLRESSQTTPLPSTGPEPIGVRFHQVDLTLTGRPQIVPLREKDSRLMPERIGAIMPLRYIEVIGWGGAFSDSSIKVSAAIAEAYQSRGHVKFEGDARAYWLNRIWKLSSHTMQATSFAGIFVDGDRERLPYEADAYINQLGWLATVGELSVPRRTFEYLIDNPNWPTEWQAHMIFMAWADYMYSGDRDFLSKHYERLKFLTLHDLISERGLITTKKITEKFNKKSRQSYPMGDIVDWPPNQRDGHEMMDENTATNAIAYHGFVIMGKIAKVLDKAEDGIAFAQHAAAIRNALHKLVLLESGLFADGVGSTHTSAHSIFLPLAFDIVADERKELFVKALEKRIERYDGGFPGSVYTAQYLLEALFKAGQDELALELILNSSDRGWLNMLKKYDATVTHESWDVKFKDNEDWTHAWGAAPANIFPRFMLGIEPVEPGWGRWKIEPSMALDFSAEASVPTPKGLARVRFEKDSNKVFIEVPEGTVCEFIDLQGTRVLKGGEHVLAWSFPQT